MKKYKSKKSYKKKSKRVGVTQTFSRRLKNGVSVVGMWDANTKTSMVKTRFKNGVKKIVSTKIISAKRGNKIAEINYRAGMKSGKY